MLTLVVFSTSTCSYCKPIKEMIESTIRPAYSEDELIITNIVIDSSNEDKQIAQHWGVHGVPTVVAINRKDGQPATEVGRYVGTEQITKDNITYCVNSFTENHEKEIPSKL